MKITPEMIRPELRFMGGVIRKVMPVFDEKGLRYANRMHRKNSKPWRNFTREQPRNITKELKK